MSAADADGISVSRQLRFCRGAFLGLFWGKTPHRSRPSGLRDLRVAIFCSSPCPLSAHRWKKRAINQKGKKKKAKRRRTRGYRDSKGNVAWDPHDPPGAPLTPRPGPHSPSADPAPPPPRRQPMTAPGASPRAPPPPDNQWERSSRAAPPRGRR